MMKLLGFLLVVAGVQATNSPQQVPIVADTPDDVAIEDVVGVHFTTSYAVAATRYQNGTTRHLATIDGDADYISVMSRWMDSYHDSNRMTKSQYESRIPTVGDVTTLTTFFSKFRIAVETELDAPISHIAAVGFPLQSLQQAVFKDALTGAGINTTETQSLQDFVVTPEADAAHAVLRSKDSPAHTASQNNFSHHAQHTLFLSFDNSSFSAGVHRLSSSTQQPHLITYSARSDLGWWNLPIFEAPRAEFWKKIQECIVDASKGLGKPPGRIVLAGSHGSDVEFKKQVEEALWNEFEFDVELLLKNNEAIDSASLAAQGTAALVQRKKE